MSKSKDSQDLQMQETLLGGKWNLYAPAQSRASDNGLVAGDVDGAYMGDITHVIGLVATSRGARKKRRVGKW
ncbi:MAG: hypothetical protein FWG15_07645 [Propionibacteriaceae bacterium]|nr:hypothetical protein [Propionibacteriaceae bacterium]